MSSDDELFAAVDVLLAGEPEMPPPAERARLREAAGVHRSEEVARAVGFADGTALWPRFTARLGRSPREYRRSFRG